MPIKTVKYSTAESINILIPTGSEEYEKMRLVFHQLLFSEEGELISVENGRTCKIIVPTDTAVAPLKKEAFF